MPRFVGRRIVAGLTALSLSLSPTTLAWAATTHVSAESIPQTHNVKKGSHPLTQRTVPRQKLQGVPQASAASGAATHWPPYKQHVPKSTQKQEYVPDHVIVKFKPGKGLSSLGATASRTGLQVLGKSRITGAQLLKVGKGQSVEDVVQLLKKSGVVEYAQPDYLVHAADVGDPPDNLFSYQWGLKNTGQEIQGIPGQPGVDIHAEQAWQKATGNNDVVVAVIDTGVDINHPDLKDHIWVNPTANQDGYQGDVNGYNFHDGNGQVFNPQGGDEHGTHVAGIITAEANGLGVVGVAQHVKIMVCKFIGSDGFGTDWGAIQAIQFASEHGARIANASWGGPEYDPALEQAIANSGMLFIAAAGNDGMNLDNGYIPSYPASYDLPNEISVAAVDNNGKLAWWSNYGANTVKVAAPGVDILSTVPMHSSPAGAGIEVTGSGTDENGNETTYHAVVQGFGLQEFDSSSTRQEIMQRALQKMGISTSDPILLVQDDESDQGLPNYLSDYEDALQGYNNVTVKTVATDADGPSLTTLKRYKAVIWFTGSSSGWMKPNLTDTDLANLDQYLQDGGALYLSGPDVLFGVEHSDFVQSTLHTDVVYDGETRNTLQGVAGTAYDGLSYTLNKDPYSALPYNDDLASKDPSSAVVDLNWPADTDYSNAYEYMSGTSMATPFVTGVAALVLSEHPKWTPETVRYTILHTTTPLDSLSGLVSTGGMVNAEAAVQFDPLPDIPGVPLTDGSATGTVDQDTKLDNVYSVHLRQGEEITAHLSSGTPNTDFDLYLYGPDATTVTTSNGIVASSEQTGTSDETITYIAPSDGTYYLDVYAYAGSGDYTLTAQLGAPVGTYQENAQQILVGGPTSWSVVPDDSASGGAYISTNSPSPGVTMYFNGTGIRYTATKGPTQGIAQVTIDGTVYPVDLYAPTVKYQQPVLQFVNLQKGEHTITIQWTGQSDRKARKSSTTINLDALTVADDTVAPSAPTGLQGTVDAKEHAVLSWAANPEPNVTGYLIERALGADPSDNDYQTIDWVDAPTTTYTDTSVELTTSYSYRVVAVNQGGLESQPSNAVVLVDNTPPAAPTGLTGRIDTTQHAVLSWTANQEPDVAGYLIQRAQGSSPKDSSFKTITSTPVTTTTFTDTSVTASVTYTYRVIAVDKAGNQSAPSQPVTLVPPPVTVEDNSSSVKYSGSWTHAKESADSGGTLSYSSSTNATAQLTFTGTDIKVLAKTASNEGQADVYIDGKFVKTIDLYSSSTKYQAVVYQQTGMSETSHTIKIVVKGKHASSSSGNTVTVDAFVYTP